MAFGGARAAGSCDMRQPGSARPPHRRSGFRPSCPTAWARSPTGSPPRPRRSVLQLYFNQVIGIPAVWVGVAIMVSLMADVMLDPLIGRWSDHFRSRWGRRHPFMYAAALPAGRLLLPPLAPAQGLSPGEIMGLAVVMMIGVRISVASYEIASSALAPELAPDYNERTSLLAYRWFFAIAHDGGGDHRASVGLPEAGRRQPAGRAEPRALRAVRDHGRGRDLRLHPGRRPPPPTAASSTCTSRRQVRSRSARSPARSGRGQAPGPGRGDGSSVLGGTGVGITSALSNYFYLHLWRLKPQAIGPVATGGLLASVMGIVVAPIISPGGSARRARCWGSSPSRCSPR